MHRRIVLATAAAVLGLLIGGGLWTSHSWAKTKGGCSDAQVCCRYVKDGSTELDCMDAKKCADQGGKEIPDKTKCAE
jgi:hypothetical protein